MKFSSELEETNILIHEVLAELRGYSSTWFSVEEVAMISGQTSEWIRTARKIGFQGKTRAGLFRYLVRRYSDPVFVVSLLDSHHCGHCRTLSTAQDVLDKLFVIRHRVQCQGKLMFDQLQELKKAA